MPYLINELIGSGYLKSPLLIEAFRAIDRKDFVPRGEEREAYGNYPLPIGWGQTISQPLTVAFMLELLELSPKQRVLDLGYGSGWQTALIAYAVGKDGKVFALEVVPELAEFGKKNIAKYNFTKKGTVECYTKNGKDGLKEKAPFDRIIVAAALPDKIPQSWKEQLADGGIIVTPVKNSIVKLRKQGAGTFSEEEYPGFAFVPFVA